MNDTATEWLNKREAAALLGVSERTLMRWVQLDRCPVHRTPGGAPRFRRDEVDALITPDPPRGRGTSSAPA
jgi:excisionase family DNA binding protein